MPLPSSEDHRRLVTALRARDGAAAVALLGDHDVHLPELAGEGLLLALAQGVPGAAELARAHVDRLRHRVYAGTEELADELEAALAGAPSALRPVPVALDDLALFLGGSIDGVILDLRTGEPWPAEAEVGLDHDEVLRLDPFDAGNDADDVLAFISQVPDPRIAERLRGAFRGRGAFRRFGDALPDRLRDVWYAFSDDRKRGRCRAWIAAHGYRPA